MSVAQRPGKSQRDKEFRPPLVKTAVWATYCLSRVPRFKVHSAKHLAFAAVGLNKDGTTLNRHARGGVIYTLEEGAWQQFKRVEGPDLQGAAMPDHCAGCDRDVFMNEQDYLCSRCRDDQG